MPAGYAVAQVEANLKKGTRKKKLKGKRADAYIYGTLNKIGMMHGNKTTAKGMRKPAPRTILD